MVADEDSCVNFAGGTAVDAVVVGNWIAVEDDISVAVVDDTSIAVVNDTSVAVVNDTSVAGQWSFVWRLSVRRSGLALRASESSKWHFFRKIKRC